MFIGCKYIHPVILMNAFTAIEKIEISPVLPLISISVCIVTISVQCLLNFNRNKPSKVIQKEYERHEKTHESQAYSNKYLFLS